MIAMVTLLMGTIAFEGRGETLDRVMTDAMKAIELSVMKITTPTCL